MKTSVEDKPSEGSRENEKADCYSDGERAAMEWYQHLRQRWLGPLLRWMVAVGISPDHLTIVSLSLGLLACPLFFWSPALAFVLLFLHAAVDGIDGPLARFRGSDSKAGSFTDTTSDQVVVVAFTITMMCLPEPLIAVLPGTVYIFLYTIVVVFAMVRNAMGIPYSWVVRPRLIVYLWLFADVFLFPGTILAGLANVLIWFFNTLFVLRMASGFFKIRAQLRNP